MSVKQRRLGTGFMPRSVTARVMIVCIWPRKKRTRSGFTAPGWSKISASAAFSCERRTNSVWVCSSPAWQLTRQRHRE